MKNIINILKYSHVGTWVRSQWVGFIDTKKLTLFGYILMALIILFINAITVIFWFFVYLFNAIITICGIMVFIIGFSFYKLAFNDTEEKFILTLKRFVNMLWDAHRPGLPYHWNGRDKGENNDKI